MSEEEREQQANNFMAITVSIVFCYIAPHHAATTLNRAVWSKPEFTSSLAFSVLPSARL